MRNEFCNLYQHALLYNLLITKNSLHETCAKKSQLLKRCKAISSLLT